MMGSEKAQLGHSCKKLNIEFLDIDKEIEKELELN